MILQAPPPSKRRGLTASQWLYCEYLTAKENREKSQMQAARQGLISICKVACGLLRPHWKRPDWYTNRFGDGDFPSRYSTFYSDAWRDRKDFAEEFVDGELKRGMTTKEARYIGRRCKFRLIDSIRRDTKFNKVREQRDQEFLKALDTVKHLRGGNRLWGSIKNSKTRRDASNTTIAKDWYRSEGWIRKLRKSLAVKLWSMVENDEQRQALEVLRLKP